MTKVKVTKAELASLLRDRKDSYELQTMTQMLELMLEEMKCKLINCHPEVVGRYQGMAQAYADMINAIQRTPVNITAPKE